MKSEIIQIRISKNEKEELINVAQKLDVPISQIVREAVRDRIADLSDSANEIERKGKAVKNNVRQVKRELQAV